MEEEDVILFEALQIAKIHPALEDAVFKDMPDFSKTGDKKFADMLYVYFKLCSILDYDSKFWASDLIDGPYVKEHFRLSRLAEVTPENNDIICTEFNVLFSKMLKKIGVKSNIRKKEGVDVLFTIYGHEHTDLEIPTNQFSGHFFGDYLVPRGYIDVNSIKISDEKVLFDLGLKENEKSLANDVLQIVKEQTKIEERKQSSKQKTEQETKQLEELYKQLGENKDISLTDQEKLKILFEQISKIDLNTFASVEYTRRLYKAISSELTEAETKYTSIREKIGEGGKYDMVGMFSIKTKNGIGYIKLTPPNKLNSISHDDLERDFMNGKYDYLYGRHVFRPDYIISQIESPYLNEKYKSDYLKYLTNGKPKKEELIVKQKNSRENLYDYFDYLIEKGVTFDKSEDAKKEENTTSKTNPQSLEIK